MCFQSRLFSLLVLLEMWKNNFLGEYYGQGLQLRAAIKRKSTEYPLIQEQSVGYGSQQLQYKGGMKQAISDVISGMCGTDRQRRIPALFIPGPVHSSWVNSVWEEESAMTFKYQMKQVKGDLPQDILHVVYHLEHVLAFIVRIT